MDTENKSSAYEFFITALLLVLTVLLLSPTLHPQSLYLLAGIGAGLLVSWFNTERSSQVLKVVINIGILLVFIWMLYAVADSTFFYKEVLRIILLCLGIVMALLSFNANHHVNLCYLQGLTVPVFLSFPILIGKTIPLPILVLACAYLVCWFALLKVKLFHTMHVLFNARSLHHSFFVMAVAFSIIASISLGLTYLGTVARLKKGGMLLEIVNDMDPDENLEKAYYSLQDKIFDKINRSTFGSQSSKDQREFVFLLSFLIKDWPYIVEVMRAEQGLISRLRNPGPGLDKGEAEGFAKLLNEYVDKKTSLSVKRSKDTITDEVRQGSFDLLQKFAVIRELNKIRSSKTYHNVGTHVQRLKEKIGNTVVDKETQKTFDESIEQLRKWKLYEIYRKHRGSMEELLKLLNEPELKEEILEIMQGIEEAKGLDSLNELQKRIDQVKEKLEQKQKEEDSPQTQEIPQVMEQLQQLKREIVVMEKSVIIAEELEKLDLSQFERQDIEEIIQDIQNGEADPEKTQEAIKELQERLQAQDKTLPPEVMEMLQIQQQILEENKKADASEQKIQEVKLEEKRRRVDFIKRLLWGIFLFLVLMSLVTFLVIFLVQYGYTRRRRKEIAALYGNPKDFIITLYENMTHVIRLFGVQLDDQMSPVPFACHVQERYSFSKSDLLDLTHLYEEAKYSRHTMDASAATAALGYYHASIDAVLLRHNGMERVMKSCIFVLNQKPLLFPELSAGK